MVSIPSAVFVSEGNWPPALFRSTSTRSVFARTADAIASAPARVDTSPSTTSTSPPAAARVSSARAASRPTTKTRTPAFANSIAAAWPSPLVAPVTTTVLPFGSMASSLAVRRLYARAPAGAPHGPQHRGHGGSRGYAGGGTPFRHKDGSSYP